MSRPKMSITRRDLMAGASAGALATVMPFGGAEAQKSGGILNVICNPEPATLMLPLSQQGPTQLIGGKIFEGLLRFTFDLKPIPALAREWKMSEDGMTYEFKLVKDAFWHDGKPFTADDVIFTTRDFLPKVHSRARNNFSHVASWEAPDPHTVIFRMKNPFGPFLGAFQVGSAPMVPKHIYEGTEYRKNPANAHPIGTGPFKFGEWRRGSHVQLVKNDKYWDKGLPRVDSIYFKIIPDISARSLAIETGDLDVVTSTDIELFDVARLTASPNIQRINKGDEFFGRVSWLEINNRRAPLNDKRFRQALMYALDRNFIHERIWFGVGKVAHSPIASTTRFHNPNSRKYPHDPKRAMALLDEMGLKPDSRGVRASLKLLQSPYGGPWARLAEYTREALSQIGVRVDLESTDAGAFAQRVSNWDYDITFNILLQFGDPALGVARSYISTNIMKGVMFSNTMGYENPRVDELFAAGGRTVKDEERQKIYDDVQEILLEEIPVVWLLEMAAPVFVSKRANDVITSGTGTYDNFAEAWVKS